MNPTLQSQFEAAKRSLVDDISGIIRRAAEEAVKLALSNIPVKVEKKTRVLRVSFNEGKFEALVNGRLVRRSRRRDLVRYAKGRGYHTAITV